MSYLALRSGEYPVDHAPLVRTQSGNQCIPQHYLEFRHTLETVEEVVSQTAYSRRYPVFVSQDDCGIFIQVGIIGPDNYKLRDIEKIVFGRRWRVEPHLPTSEIIQTVFLALKKAREHEIREQFILRFQDKVTTPFNCHHDLPLMAHLSKGETSKRHHNIAELNLSDVIQSIRFDGVNYNINETLNLTNGAFVLTLSAATSHSDFIEIYGPQLSFVVPNLDPGTVLHTLMTELIRLSDRHVDEGFTFDGFARFSHKVDPLHIAEMSATYRAGPSKFIDPNAKNTGTKMPNLHKAVKSMNYDVDQKRIPTLSNSSYATRLKSDLSELGIEMS